VLVIIVAGALFVANHWFNVKINALKTRTKIIEPVVPAPGSRTPAAVQPAQTKTPAEPEGESAEKKPATDSRDPFLASKNPEKQQPVVNQKKPVIDLKVSGILWDENIPTAIINSQVVKIGDIIYGKTVVDMEKDAVILMEDGELLVIKLHKE
jgi:hypothetical protein